MIRIGIVGCGRILAAHLLGYRRLREAGVDDFRITALCARREADAWMYVQRGQGPPQRPPVSDIAGDPLAVGDVYLSDFQNDVPVQVYGDYRQMIAEGPVDAINDFSSHGLHHQVAAVAIGHGKDLLTQKPLAVTVAAARQMCRQAEAADRVLGVFENVRNKPHTRHLKWLFQSGLCGRLQMLLLGSIGAWWAPDRIVAETPWRHRRDQAGGITLDLGVHQAHLVRYLAGEILNVTGRTAVLEPVRVRRDAQGRVTQRVECDADDTFFATLETEHGVLGNLAASWGGHGQKTLIGQGAVYYGTGGCVTGDDVTLDPARPVADDQPAVLSQSTGQGPLQHILSNQPGPHSLRALYEAGCDPRQRARHFPLGLQDPFALNQYDWLEAIRQRREPETSGRQGLRDLAVAFAILESASAGRRVQLDEVLSGTLRPYQHPLDQYYGLQDYN